MKDFCTYFEEMDICCDSPNFVDGDDACQWNCSMKEGRWETGQSAGGCDSEAGQYISWLLFYPKAHSCTWLVSSYIHTDPSLFPAVAGIQIQIA